MRGEKHAYKFNFMVYLSTYGTASLFTAIRTLDILTDAAFDSKLKLQLRTEMNRNMVE